MIGIKKWVCNILYVFKYFIWYRKYLKNLWFIVDLDCKFSFIILFYLY